MAIISIYFAITIGFMLASGFSDPGIIPRQPNPNQNENLTEEERYQNIPAPRINEVKNIGKLESKYCGNYS